MIWNVKQPISLVFTFIQFPDQKSQKPPIVVRYPCLRIPFKQIFNLSHSWDEFEQMRRDMIAESRQAWNKFDEDMKRLETKSFSKSLNIDTNLNEANNPTPPKDEVKQEKKETNVVEEIKTKDLGSEKAWNKFGEDMKRLETKSFSKSLNIDTNLNEANDPTPPKKEVKEEKKETNVLEEIKTKDLKSENLDEDRRSFFSPIKFVRFPSMFGDEKVENRSLFKDENVIKVNFEWFFNKIFFGKIEIF